MGKFNAKNEEIASLKAKRTNDTEHVLVTGAAGFIGSNLCAHLVSGGNMVYGVDNFITGEKKSTARLLEEENFRFFEIDIVSDDFLKKFSKLPLKKIFHLACPTGVPNIKKLPEEMLMVSSIGTRNVMEVAKACGAKVVFSSSCEIYGQPEKFPQDENYAGNVDPVGPRSPYEEGKRFSESLIMMYVKKYGVDADIVRLFNGYGPGMRLEDPRVIPRFLKSVFSNKKPVVYGDGNQTRTFLYVDDLVNGLVRVMESGSKGNVYNIGSVEQVSINELSEIMSEIVDWKGGVEHREHFIDDHCARQPSIEKNRSLGWRKKITLRKGIEKTVEYFLNEQKNKIMNK